MMKDEIEEIKLELGFLHFVVFALSIIIFGLIILLVINGVI